MFKHGDKVLITGHCYQTLSIRDNYSAIVGMIGTVVKYQSLRSGKCVISIDGKPNPNAGTGYYYLPDKYLKLVNEREENIMSKLTGFKNVAVVKIGSIDYHYALYDNDIVVGDKVLVSGACGKVVEISDIITTEEAKEKYSKLITSEVICKVDFSAYDKRVADRAEAEKLKKKMDEEIKKMDEINKYAMYAATNPALAEMLKEYQNLIG